MSVATLTREPCRTCSSTTLHDRCACVHCGTVAEYVQTRDRPPQFITKSARVRASRGGRLGGGVRKRKGCAK